MFLVAVLALLVVVPLGLKYLPETLAPASAGKAARKAAPRGRRLTEPAGFSSLLRAPYLGISMLFARWRPLPPVRLVRPWHLLPNLMQLAGYNSGPP